MAGNLPEVAPEPTPTEPQLPTGWSVVANPLAVASGDESPATDEAVPKKRRRALEAARRIERTADLVRRARSHAREAQDERRRKLARNALKKLRTELESLQRSVIREGLSSGKREILDEALGPVEDTIERFLGAVPAPELLKEVRKRARGARRILEGL